MMNVSLLAALLLQTGPLPLPVTVPVVAEATADPTCGGRAPVAAIATCVSMTQAGVETVAAAYDADFQRQGWVAADGTDNRVIYIRRKEGGGCDAFQLLAFPGATVGPSAPAYIALATVPGDPCTAAAQAPAGPTVAPPAQ